MNPVIVKIKDYDEEAEFDMFFHAPQGMNEKEAVELVDKAIRKVQEAAPCEYVYDDLENELVELGFEAASFAVANERW